MWRIIIIGLILLFLFGGKRFGAIGKALGEGIRNFKKGLADSPPASSPSPPPAGSPAPPQLTAHVDSSRQESGNPEDRGESEEPRGKDEQG